MAESAHHRVSEAEAREYVKHSEEADGPHVIADKAKALYDAIVPPHMPDLDYLAGRGALNFEETKLWLGIGSQALRTAVRKGQIPSLIIGNRRMFPVKAVERHMEALAYAESGALDAWEAALVKGAASRLKRMRRTAWERRKTLRRKMREAQRRVQELKENPGMPKEYAVNTVAELAAVRAELTTEEAIAERVGKDIQKDIDQLVRDFELTLDDMDSPRLGMGPKISPP